MNRGAIPALILVLIGALQSSSEAAVLLVPSQYPTIQAAVDAAQAGDEIRVAAGTYEGPGFRMIDFQGKDLAVMSESGAAATIVQGAGDSLGFYLHSGETSASRIEGFTLRWFSSGYEGTPYQGGAVYCDGAAVSIRNCIVRDCGGSWASGGGIALRNGGSVIQDCLIEDCGAGHQDGGPVSASGGGILAETYDGGVILIERCIIRDCWVADQVGYAAGGGIFAGRNVMVRDCEIRNCRSTDHGGGVATSGALENCVIVENSATDGAGGVIVGYGSATLFGCTIARNNGGDGEGGGGIYVSDLAAAVAERCLLWGNCTDGLGEDVRVPPGGSIRFSCCDITPGGVSADGTVEYGPDPSISLDPYFCDPADCGGSPQSGGEYHIAANSPCLPGDSPCNELIGALAEGCGPTAVKLTTWGQLKSSFLRQP